MLLLLKQEGWGLTTHMLLFMEHSSGEIRTRGCIYEHISAVGSLLDDRVIVARCRTPPWGVGSGMDKLLPTI